MSRPTLFYNCVLFLTMATCLGAATAGCSRNAGERRTSGVVVDTAGAPLADVCVFNAGDGPKRTETRTDDAGKFHLSGLNASPFYLFAEKAGYRFGGVRATAESPNITITLLRSDEPPPALPAAAAPLSLEQQRALAKGILEQLWAAEPQSRQFLVRRLSQFDPAQALRWATELNDGSAKKVQAALAQQVADDDLDEALALLNPLGAQGIDALLKLTNRYCDTDPDKANQCMEELVIRVRTLDQPWRIGYLALTSSLVRRLGNDNSGRALLAEAVAQADKLGAEREPGHVRGMIAQALAPFDLPRALALLAPLTTRKDQDEYLGNAAVAIGVQDLEKALDVVGQVQSAAAANRARLQLAYRLAPRRPQQALRVAELIGQDSKAADAKEFEALALGWMATAIAPHDKSTACSWIDRGLAILMTCDLSRVSGDFHNCPAIVAGFLAWQAQQIGYPDMHSVVYRALACRPPTSPDNTATACSNICKITMATFLGLVDRQAACELLQVSVAAGPGVPEASLELAGWLLADSEHGEQTCCNMLAAARGDSHSPADVRNAWLAQQLRAADILGAAPREKALAVVPALRLYCPAEE